MVNHRTFVVSILKEEIPMSDLEIIFKGLVLCGGGFLTLVFGAIAWWLIRISPGEYRKLHKASPSFVEALLGVGKRIKNPAAKNCRQRVFPAINLRNNQWEIRSVLKDDSLREL